MRSKGLLLSMVLLLAGGCSSSGPSTPPPPPPPPGPPPANTFNVGPGNSYNPTTLTVARNTTVTWAFQSGPHTVTFQDGVQSSGQQSSGTHTRSFSTAGTYKFRCTIHSTDFTAGMIGEVVVQ